jgi:predicted nucleic acid-binding protein
MTIYYLDASAWVKRYYVEPGSGWVRRLFQQSAVFASASLGLVEVASTLARKEKAGDIPRSRLDQALLDLRQDWQQFAKVHLTDEVLTDAFRVARANALRGSDAVHLASALLLKAGLAGTEDEMILVTSDRELREAGQASGLHVVDPTNP